METHILKSLCILYSSSSSSSSLSLDTVAKTCEKTDPFLHHRERWCFFKRSEKRLWLPGTQLQTRLHQTGTRAPG